jgi:hypothetical protein
MRNCEGLLDSKFFFLYPTLVGFFRFSQLFQEKKLGTVHMLPVFV